MIVALEIPRTRFGGYGAPALVEKAGPAGTVLALRSNVDGQRRRELRSGEAIVQAVARVVPEMGEVARGPNADIDLPLGRWPFRAKGLGVKRVRHRQHGAPRQVGKEVPAGFRE